MNVPIVETVICITQTYSLTAVVSCPVENVHKHTYFPEYDAAVDYWLY